MTISARVINLVNRSQRIYKKSVMRYTMTFCRTSTDLEVLGLRPSRNLGQNFLTDTNIADWIVQQADIQTDETILEIGPGLGILTQRIKKFTKNIIAIELDKRLAEHVQEKYNIQVIQGDAVKTEFPKFDKVVSNLPYQISSPITFKILDTQFKKGILMYQKEFAQHLVAQPGERTYSRVSVMASYRGDCKIIKDVSKEHFHPEPKVDAAIVEIIPKKPDFEMLDHETFRIVVRALFSHKNRKVRNGIVAEHKVLGLEKDAAKELAEKLPYFDQRPITLSAAKLGEISNYIFETGS